MDLHPIRLDVIITCTEETPCPQGFPFLQLLQLTEPFISGLRKLAKLPDITNHRLDSPPPREISLGGGTE
jgi:hypothetical protein